MKQVSTRSIILRRINYGEADRILTIISSDQGKVSLIAKGSRKSKSKLAGGLELFSESEISYIEGKSDLKTVISARVKKNYGRIVDDIDVAMLAYDFLKNIDVSTQESCGGEYFDLLNSALDSLNESPENSSLVKLWFSIHLLDLKGVAINLEKLINGKDFNDDQEFQFDFDDMGFFVHDAGPYKPKHIKFLRLLMKVSKPENLLKVTDAQGIAEDLCPLLDHCLKL